ncbi:VWA domain-containing protein [Desulfonema ishimotonii]|uniref:VWA domain-containing protein n=1 Tax=Desulfonema ishimotonii TaxID=45657 RepID=A0A401FUD2_9BACT|nr:VWA domain-containing protein [Desulfonema ishimotonii]GBC60565.1 VWA domain-containing protein [Desulfonema ishimotonii]
MKNESDKKEALRRWRLILGPYGDDALADAAGAGQGKKGALLNGEDVRRDRVLHYLYGREYKDRQADADGREGGAGASRMSVPHWLGQVRRLFPRSTVETLQRHALERYEMTALLTDPEVLEKATPSVELVRTLISFRSLLPPASMTAARKVIRAVVRELEEKLARKVRNAIQGPRCRHRHGGRPGIHNLDWKTTIRRNIRHFQPSEGTLVPEHLYFFQRSKRRLPWDIFILVDQSGSMLDSVIHSAVLAAIFYGLSSLRARLILFDTQVVDLTDRVDDPVEVLLGVQLGGGTDIGSALEYASGLVRNPGRTIVVLISDFYEGGRPGHMEAVVRRLSDAGVTLLGLAALDDRAEPDYNRHAAQQLADIGMEIGAMTPDRLAEWVGNVMAGK